MSLPILRDLLAHHFSHEELRGLCFDLGLEYEDLPGETRPGRAQSLIEHCLRRGRLPDLHRRCGELRPQVAWPDLPSLSSELTEVQQQVATAQERLQGVLPADQVAAMLAPLRQKELDLLARLVDNPAGVQASLHGSGAIAQGEGAQAAGQQAIIARGNVGLGITGNENIVVIAADVAAEYLRDILPQRLSDQRLRQATEQYLAHLITRYRFLDFKGMGVSDRIPLRLPLVRMYVPLKARIEMPAGDTWARLRLAGREIPPEEAEALGERVSQPLPLLELLARQDGLVILGDPGAGKTTFLKYLALRLALGEAATLGLGARLPVLLPLSAYANALARQDVALDQFISRYYRDLGVKLPLDAILAAALAEGGVLLLLDGLDEVKETALRSLVANRVVAFYAAHRAAGNKFILTSRIVGYREVRLTAEGLAECTLVDFDDDEIALFVGQWTQALEEAAHGQGDLAQAEAQRERDELLAAVAHNPGVRRLAANPLLLTILALMKRQGIALPERRVELYQKYVETLLKHWNLARGLDRPPSRDLDVVETLRVLAPLALWMHETSPGVGLVKQQAMRRRLESIYRQRGLPEPERAAAQFLTDVREYAGLLVERGPGQFGFIHLTFQEYLAGVAIAQQAQQDVTPVVTALAAHVADDNWREVSLLAIGYLGLVQQRDEAAGEALQQLIQAAPGEPGMAEILAAEAVLDTWPGGVTAACRAAVVAALQAAMVNESRVAVLRQAAAGRLLARLGDPRPGVGTILRSGQKLPDIVWGGEVPAGTYTIGDDKSQYSDEKPRQAPIKQPYRLARYPVTYAQFQCFVDAPDFDDERWWAGMPGDAQELAEQRFPFANHPRETVSWYQAMALCRWLTAKLHAGELPAGELTGDVGRYEITLPHEYEWEVAARWPNSDVADRLYPWGAEFDAAKANTWEGGIGQTTAVGIYPAGQNAALGLYDLSGNVWEWCRNKYEYPDDEVVDDSGQGRVLRGGSWNYVADYARAASRDYGAPANRGSYGGFRLVVGGGGGASSPIS